MVAFLLLHYVNGNITFNTIIDRNQVKFRLFQVRNTFIDGVYDALIEIELIFRLRDQNHNKFLLWKLFILVLHEVVFSLS